ncbi:hypothetical protein G5I_00640 [Acromyrmex echinatior]|uniref:Platelet-derived growth factor (PDGF) family profile domain-containing protein n=1 Tax=Acromyrmex echinatior TaxID=103372 RepID=F4W5E3_ACREC|nr:hypothetical protein G5I_00640 [Acromyrmex echinatior]
MSAHSVHKWQSLGTREGVKETRSNMQQYNKNGKSAEIREALQHAIKVNKEGSCQWPRARVIPVRDVYPSPSTTYIPHCAILHRCSDDTGCCRSETLTCVPKHSHRIELSFYVSRSFFFFFINLYRTGKLP